jgi:carboxypeptidase Taq
MAQARQDLGGLYGDFRAGQFGRLKQWLNDKIHRHGQRWRAGELCVRATGKPLTHKPLIAYLREKYAPLYGI